MSGYLDLELLSYGSESRGAPVRVQVLDAAMHAVVDTWVPTPSSRHFPLEPGLYGVRVTVASGARIDQLAEIREGAALPLAVPLHRLSPHEGHEWAYFAQSLSAPGGRSLDQSLYDGAWLRMWEKAGEGWQVIALSQQDMVRLTDGSDGITYRLNTPAHRPYVLQTGGTHIPWRCTALPPAQKAMVLVKAAGPGADYPLDVAVSSEDWRLEMLLGLLQRGEITVARDMAREAQIAEDLLYGKVQDPGGAAVAGYFLLKIRDFAHLHDWARHLADWISWMPDGPVVHAWQLLAQAADDAAGRAGLTVAARDRLLEATNRGVPLFTEGVRLLRDGLLGLHRSAGGKDDAVAEALDRVGAYVAALEPDFRTTTFTGVAPDQPDELPRVGIPTDAYPLVYIFNVPVSELLSQRLLEPGATLETEGLQVVLQDDGTVRTPDGRSFRSLASAESGAASQPMAGGAGWHVGATGESLRSLADSLRRNTFTRPVASPPHEEP